MFKNLFSSSSKETLTGSHLKKCTKFIHYLVSKGVVKSVVAAGKEINLEELSVPLESFHTGIKTEIYASALSCFINTMGQSTLFDYDTALRNSKYFLIVDPKHSKIAGHLTKLGLNFFEGNLENNPESPVVLIGGTDINYQKMGSQVKVAALIHVYNESDMLAETIHFLIEQGVHVHIIDNWSTDGSWEIAGSFPVMQVTKERFPPEGPSDHYEWFKQCEYSEQLSKQLSYDWFLHYDADELRYTPWKNVTLQKAIGFIDSLGYNAIDFTVLDFRYTTDKDNVTVNVEKNNIWFEFGKRPGHFRQVKCWKKQRQLDLKSSGGHHVDFQDIHIYPVKFLNKHYSLRSKEQAQRKLVVHRLPRTQKEKGERGWHTHIDMLIEQQAKGWNKKDLIEWKENSFQQDYLLERISGVGIID
jgi:hypothetical protein